MRFTNGFFVGTRGLVLGLATLLAGCGGGNGEDSAQPTGSIDLALETGLNTPITTITKVNYKIHKSDGGLFTDGVIDVTNSTRLSALIGGLPAAIGYDIELSTTAINIYGSVLSCFGSSNFDIVAELTTSTTVHLTCTVPSTNGSVAVNGTFNTCPTIEFFNVLPTETTVGHDITLTAGAIDPDQNTLYIYQWTSSGGILSKPNSHTTTWTCTAPGQFTVSIGISDGDPACTKTESEVVSCVVPE